MSKRVPKAPAPAWTGHLSRTPDGIRGRLDDPTGWTLLLTGIQAAVGNPGIPVTPTLLHLRGDVAEIGTDEGPDRAILAELPFLLGRLERDGGDWRGELAIRGLVVTLTGTAAGPGHIALTGIG